MGAVLNPIHLQTLAVTVRRGSFAEAARELGYTASAVSQQIALLERTLSTELFERTARSIRPTPVAVRLAELSDDGLATLTALERDARRLVAGEAGTFRLASFATASATIVSAVFAELLGRRPGTEVLLDEGEPTEVLGPLTEGRVDAALVYSYSTCPQVWPAQLRCQPLLEDPLVLVVPPRHRLTTAAREDPEIGLSALAEEHWIAARPETRGATTLVRLAASAGFTPQVRLRSNDYTVIAELVRRGLGIALVPTLGLVGHAEDLPRLGLRGIDAHRTISLLYRAANHNPLLPEVADIAAGVGRRLTAGWRTRPSIARAEGKELSTSGPRPGAVPPLG